MRLRQLEYLAALERWGSYARAAEMLFVSQPAMSMAIRALEEELGCQIVRRTGRGVTFTPRGQLILEQAHTALAAVREIAKLAAEDGESGLRGRLRVGALPHLGATAGERARAALTAENPGLDIELIWGDSAALAEAVERGDLDLAVVHSCELRQERGLNRLRSGVLSRDELCLMAVEGHPLAGLAAPVSREALMSYPFFVFRDYAAAEEFGYTRAARRFDDMAGMRRAMAAENGLALLPKRCLNHGNGIYTIRFVPIETEWPNPVTDVLWLHGPGRLSAAEQAFVELLDRWFAQEAGAVHVPRRDKEQND